MAACKKRTTIIAGHCDNYYKQTIVINNRTAIMINEQKDKEM